MGMFDKDREIGLPLTTAFNFGQDLVLWDAIDGGKVKTEINAEARKTRLIVSEVGKDRIEAFEVSTLSSAIADKAAMRTAEGSEFPAVVRLLKVPSNKGNDATVLQFVREGNK